MDRKKFRSHFNYIVFQASLYVIASAGLSSDFDSTLHSNISDISKNYSNVDILVSNTTLVRSFDTGNSENGNVYVFETSDEPDTTTPSSTTVNLPSTTWDSGSSYPEERTSWVKLTLLSLVSLTIPVGFMSFLMWRLHKDKKYLDPSTGALVYRETVIVPSYNYNSNDPSGIQQPFSIVQMHTLLGDSPPDYDTVIKPPIKSEIRTPEDHPNTGNSNNDEPPPPSYSSVQTIDQESYI